MRTGAMAGFSQDPRWPCWQDEVAPLSPDQGIAVYPFVVTVQSRPISRASSRPVPVTELLTLHADIQ